MGLFEIQRQLAAESSATQGRAEQATADHAGPSAFLAEAWHNVRDPRYVARLFAARARTDPSVALVLARLEHDEPPSRDALAAEQRSLVAPLITSDLFTDQAHHAARQLVALGDPQSVPAMQQLAASTRDERLRLALHDAIATWGDAAAADAIAVPAQFAAVTATLARRGHAAAQAALLAALRNFLNEWHRGVRIGSDDWDVPSAIVTAIGEARFADGVPLLLACLVTPLAPLALHALADLAAVKARDPARAVLRELGGTQPARAWAYRLAAERLLATLGEPPPLDTAREVLATAYPRSYGYPKHHEVVTLRAHALAAVVDRGSDDDRELAATHLTSPYPELRKVAAAAIIKLGRPIPALQFLDEPRSRQILERDGVDALITALAAPHTVFKHLAAAVLSTSKQPAAREAALGWALDVLERTPNHPASHLEPDAIGIEADAALEIAATLHKDTTLRPRLAAASSAWLREGLFKEKPRPTTPPLHAGPWRASVRRLDRAPFIFGQQINALALDTAGRRLAVVGERLGQIVDATTGDTIVALSLEYAWANDCAFSPDGSALAVAYHGCHVVIFDASTGQRLRTMDGFGGVPDATRRLAFAPDGELLGFAGSDGSARLVRWRTGEEVWHTAPRTGSFEAITFSEEGTCLFSHVKVRGGEKNSLLRVDLATLGSTTIDMPSSMWSLARAGGRWYAGGDGKKIRPLGRELKPARTGALEMTGVVRLARAPDDTLLAVSQAGALHRWNITANTSATILADAGKLWALAVAPDGTIYTAGAAGIVHRFTREGVEIRGEHGEVHTKQITSIVPLPDGTTLTSAWDGRLLRWPVGFGTATPVHHHDKRLTGLAVAGDTVYAGADGRILVIDLTTTTARTIDLGRARVEDLLLAEDTLHVALNTGVVRSFSATDLSQRAEVDLGGSATALARTAEGTLLVGTEGGLLLELDAAGQISWSRAEFGRDLVDKDPHGDPHRTVVGITVHAGKFAAAANDDTLRVFDRATYRRTLRLFTDASLFNNCEFTPDGHHIAVTGSHGLAVFDATTGALALHLHALAFPGADELTIFTFTSPHRALVGAENGGLFEVTLEAP